MQPNPHSLEYAAALAWEAANVVRGSYGAQPRDFEDAARVYLGTMSAAHNYHLRRLAKDAARCSSYIRAIPRDDGRTAEIVSIA